MIELVSAVEPWLRFRASADDWTIFEAWDQRVFEDVVYDKPTNTAWEVRRETQLRRFLAELEVLAQPMDQCFADFPASLAEQSARFFAAFPDAPRDIRCYLIPSLLTFNGRATTLTGDERPALFFGADLMAKRGDDPAMLISHEMFHVYHDALRGPDWSETLLSALWSEGLATYASQVLNPTIDDGTALMDPQLAAAAEDDETRSHWATDFWPLRNSLDQRDWFTANGTTMPTRRGYALGLHVVRTLAASHSLSTMAQWSPEAVEAQVSRYLFR